MSATGTPGQGLPYMATTIIKCLSNVHVRKLLTGLSSELPERRRTVITQNMTHQKTALYMTSNRFG